MSTAITHDIACERCGAGFTIEIPDQFGSFGRHVPVVRFCDPCNDLLERVEVEQRDRDAWERRVQRSDLHRGLRGHTFAEMIASHGRDPAIQAAREWAADDEPGGLCFFGPVGAGKTRLAATAAWARLERLPIRWISVPRLLAELLGALDDQDRHRAVKVIAGRGPLVLDDLDKTNASEWARTQLFSSIDERVNAEAPLLITTNLPPEQIEGKLGDPIASRIAGYCRVFELPGPDYRLESKRESKAA